MAEKCKEMIFDEWHRRRCRFNAKRDGFCNMHHPDTVKARKELASKKYEEAIQKSPLYQLRLALEKIRILEIENESLKDEIRRLKNDT